VTRGLSAVDLTVWQAAVTEAGTYCTNAVSANVNDCPCAPASTIV